VQALRLLTAAVLAVLTPAVVTLGAVSSASASTKAAAAGSGCYTVYQPPRGWVVVCSGGGGTGGGPGSGGGGGGGGGGGSACTVTVLSPPQVAFFGLGKPPAGDKWAAITCPGNQPFGGITAVGPGAGGVPAVTWQELLTIAENQLNVPVLRPRTKPNLGAEGLVGLPEWYWIPGPAGTAPVRSECAAQVAAAPAPSWHTIVCAEAVGAVWAEVVAYPTSVSFNPGGGLAGSQCTPGPGVPWTSAASSQGACTFTYDQSSALQPGAKYAAGVTVNWTVEYTHVGTRAWQLLKNLAVTYGFPQRVAEGQALVTNP
jgi:hypothetical protein